MTMKYNKISKCLIAALCCVTAFTSCSDEVTSSNPEDAELVEMTFNAEIESADLSSRTYVGEVTEGVTNTYWHEGDKINVYYIRLGSSLSSYPFTGAYSDSRYNKFTGKSISSSIYFAVYPYQSENPMGTYVASTKLSLVTITIPSEQKASVGTYDRDAAIMTAASTAQDFVFKSACALIKVRLDKSFTNCTKITISSEDNLTYLSGDFSANISPDDGTATLRPVTTIGKTKGYVSLVPAKGADVMPTESDLYIAMAPGTVNKFKLTCETVEGDILTKTGSAQKTFAHGEVWSINDLKTSDFTDITHECSHTYVDAEGTLPSGVSFVDLGTGDGVCWATMNLGAEDEFHYGDYYAWGATTPYCIAYDVDEDGNVSARNTPSVLKETHWLNNTLTPYAGYTQDNAPYYSGSGYTKYTDNGDVLDLSDDAARSQWGNNETYGIKMPTYENIKNLVENCCFVYCDGKTRKYNESSTPGIIVFKARIDTDKGRFISLSESTSLYYAEYETSRRMPHIFIPLAQSFEDNDIFDSNSAVFWSSTVAKTGANDRTFLFSYDSSSSTGPTTRLENRYLGLPIRPVCSPKFNGDNYDYIYKSGLWD